jgi:hypothetical protein
MQVLKYAWGDPVWSKVIATLIAALIIGIVSTVWRKSLLAWWKSFRDAFRAAGRAQNGIIPDLKLIQVYSTPPDRAGLTYPIKCYVELRNDSDSCLGVRFSEYKSVAIPAKTILLNVLQIKFGSAWVPFPEAERVAILPGQLLRIWIPVDEEKYTSDGVNDLRGNIGEIVLLVDGRLMPFRI